MKKTRNETVVGMFVVMGFILLTLVIFFISGVYFFKAGYAVDVIYDYVSILDRGAPVRMAGVRVGEVNKVSLYYDTKKGATRVLVKLFIKKGVEIRENYVFNIRGTHIMSEPHIEITPRAGNFPVLKPKSVIEGATPVAVEELIKRGQDIANNLASIVENVNGALKDKDSLKEIVTNTAKITRSLESALNGGSEGDLKQSIANIKTSTDALNTVLQKVEKGDGTVGSLLMKDDLYQELKGFVSDLRAHPWKLLKKEDSGRKKKFFFF